MDALKNPGSLTTLLLVGLATASLHTYTRSLAAAPATAAPPSGAAKPATATAVPSTAGATKDVALSTEAAPVAPPAAAPAVPPTAAPVVPPTAAPVVPPTTAPAGTGSAGTAPPGAPDPQGSRESTVALPPEATAIAPQPQLLRGGRGRIASRGVPPETTAPQDPPAPPKTSFPLGLEFSVMPVWQTGRGYDLFSRNDISTRTGLALDLELADLAEKTTLSFDVGWSVESQSDSALSVQSSPTYVSQNADLLYTTLTAHNFHAGFKLRYQLLPFLAPHVRLAAGATSLSTGYDVSSSMSAGHFESHDWLAFGTLGAGVTATLPTTIVVRPGLVVEGGYLFSQGASLRFERNASSEAIALSAASLGTLERSGAYLKFGAFIRY